MGEELDLKILITALLNSKGFEDAQAQLRGLGTTATGAAPAVGNLGEKTKGLTKELGGSRGAVADMTRVLLMNIGVTGASGEVAKAAGLAMNMLSGSAGLVGVSAAALVAALALLLPKLKEWGVTAEDIEAIHKGIAQELASELPQLKEYIEKVDSASRAIREQYAAVLQLVAAQQRLEALELSHKIAEHERQYKTLMETISGSHWSWQRLIGVQDTSQQAAARWAAQAAILEAEIKQEKARLDELNEAIVNGAVADLQRADAMEKSRKAEHDAAEATRKRNQELADQLQLSRDLRAESARLQQQENKDRIESRKRREQDIQTSAERILQIEAENEARMREVIAAKLANEQITLAELKRLRESRLLTDAELKLINERIRARKAEAASIAQLWTQAITTLVGAFTKNKAINIAAAIADTWAAANVALRSAPPPYNYALMAAVIAQGLANVQRIREQEVGFDDPFNDMLANKLGRRSAADFLRHFGEGFEIGMSGRGGGGVTNNYHRTTINRGVNIGPISGVVGSKTELRRWLQREMTAADRAERRSSI
ncbi:MAG TPA: hypothetical protein VGQ24_10600 [Gemmatimonadales bacterium]|jgi:hypothetical protein|nr:hypothetical protein [Gemmatimonadales bacterium]